MEGKHSLSNKKAFLGISNVLFFVCFCLIIQLLSRCVIIQGNIEQEYSTRAELRVVLVMKLAVEEVRVSG